MGVRIRLCDRNTGAVKSTPTGFSWTTWFFGGIPAFFFRRDRSMRSNAMLAATLVEFVTGIGTAGIPFVLGLVGWFFVAAKYNEWYIKDLIEQGLVPQDEHSHTTLKQIGIVYEGAVYEDRVASTSDIDTFILQEAMKRGGIVSVVFLAADGRYGLEELKRALDSMADSGYVELRVRRTGDVIYTIPEMLSDENRENLEPMV